MDVAETIAIIRDLFIIAAAAVFIAVFIPIGILFLRMAKPLIRAADNLENISSTVLNQVIKPLSTLGGLLEFINRILGQWRERTAPDRSKGDGQE